MVQKNEMKKILFLGASSGTIDMLEYAKSIGCHTIVTDYLTPDKSIAKQLSDESWQISTSDLDTLELKCRDENIEAIVCGASEFNIDMYLELCKRLNIPSFCTPEAWHFARDKADFKNVCKKVGAPVPTDYYISNELSREELDTIVYPVMVKPVDRGGNTGISYCYNEDDLLKAIQLARSVTNSDKLVIERMLHGKEWWAGYAFAEGEASLVSLNALYSQPGEPANCYTLTTTVSDNVEKFIKEINPQIEQSLKAVGCKEGYAWVQVMLDEDGHFYIIEMGYRLTGESIQVPLKHLIGFDVSKWLVDLACGVRHTKKDLPKPQKHAFKECACAMHLFTNKAGVITEIEGWNEISQHNHIKTEQFRSNGQKLEKYATFGNVLFYTKSIEEMCDCIDYVNKTLHVLNENGEDMIIKYTNFDYLKNIYDDGRKGL